ncbi:NPP1 family protein [Streptomyces goshikiensis]|uniref:NPP1 family protein n=1 Tax=Streptomyces goshikiensis TaxID=1942 RepID=UPI003710D49B
MKWQPALDYDTDGCYNVPAIGPDGRISEGLGHDNTTGERDCRDRSDLDNTNAYSRQRCNSGWCVYLYDYYFEKDVAVQNVADAGGHVHDWGKATIGIMDSQFAANIKGSISTPQSECTTTVEGTVICTEVPVPLISFDFDRDEGSPGFPPEPDEPGGEPGGTPGPTGAHLRVMPLGDSITYGVGSSTKSSYRADLWKALKAHTDGGPSSARSSRGACPTTTTRAIPGAASTRWRPSPTARSHGRNRTW